MLTKLWYCVVTGLLVAISCIGCKVPDMWSGSAVSRPVQVAASGRSWTVSSAGGIAVRIREGINEFEFAAAGGCGSASLSHDIFADGLYRVSFALLASSDVASVRFSVESVRSALQSVKNSAVLSDGGSPPLVISEDFIVDVDGSLVDVVFNFVGPVRLRFCGLDGSAFVVRGFRIAEVISASW